ncbi:hypothetical protein JW948_14070 [bacterium]|nr:hypothetical protein [bacterium]
MVKFWDNLKQKFGEGSKPIKEGIESTSKTVTEKGREIATKVSEKTPEITDKTKKIATKVAEKTGEVVTAGKLRLKLYNLKRDADKIISSIGSRTYELVSKKKTVIYEDKEIQSLIQELNGKKKEIKAVEKEIKSLE